MPQKVEIILASGSPRRRELLEREGVSFTVLSADVDESLEPDLLRQPEEAAKSSPSARRAPLCSRCLAILNTWVLRRSSAPTPWLRQTGRSTASPSTKTMRAVFLGELSGRPHQVITGVSVWLVSAPPNKEVSLGFRTFTETSHVTFKELTDEVIAEYVAGGEPMDKAGAYGIQGDGRALVESIDGDFDNIVGLPVKRLMNEFSEIFEAAQ